MKKKAKDLTGLSIGKRQALLENGKSGGVGTGIAGDSLYEGVPRFLSAPNENIIKSENNSWIVLGRDRPSDRLSGYGGRGDTHTAMIDLVAGRMGTRAKEVDENNTPQYVNNNYTLDAARIYLSQKTDVDDNFNLADGSVGNSQTRSAVAIKADGVRIIGREGIKLVTKTDGENSQGGRIDAVYGIDLIAGNDDRDLQPIPKGKNLEEALDALLENVKNLTGLLETFITSQMKFNQSVTTHTHIGNLGAPTTPSIELVATGIVTNLQQVTQNIAQLPLHRTNIEVYKMNYLSPVGKKYINSRHNHTN